jgi:hypothetical protein
MRLGASGQHTPRRRHYRRAFVVVFATALVCWGAGPALADEDPDVPDPTGAVDIGDVEQPVITDTPFGGRQNESEPSPDESDSSIPDSGSASGDAVDDADESPGAETPDAAPSETPPQDPPADPSPGPIEGDVDTDVVVTPPDAPDAEVVDSGGWSPSGGDAAGGQDSGTNTSSGEDVGGIEPDTGSSADAPVDSEEMPDGETTEPEPADKEDASDAVAVDDNVGVGGAEPTEGASDLEEVDIVDSGNTDVFEAEPAYETTVAPVEDETHAPKKPASKPSPREVRWDLPTDGLPGVKSGRSNAGWSDAGAVGDHASLRALVIGGNHIHGTASVELAADETDEVRKSSSAGAGKAFSMPFSNGFGMPLTGFDILVMSVMGLSLILVGVILFARGIERQSAVRKSTQQRDVANASPSPAVRETEQPLLSRIKDGVKRKRVV